MTVLADQLRESLHQLPQPPARLLVAVSGGADSVALLRGLHELRQEQGFALYAAHFNHQTRGQASADDQQWVETLCRRWEIPCEIGFRSLPEQKETEQKGLSENSLRKLRLSFLEQTARQQQIPLVCLGHHQQDQVETVLHHLLRGTSLRGLTGIPECRSLSCDVQLYRPLLGVSRAVILEYLHSIGQEYRHDASNDSPAYTRNRIRHELLPLLEQIMPQAPRQLLRLQQQAAQTQDFHQSLVKDLLEKVVLQQSADIVRLRRDVLQQTHPVLVRELFVTLWAKQNWPRGEMGSREWERLRQFLEQSPRRMELPGPVVVEKRGDLLLFSHTPG